MFGFLTAAPRVLRFATSLDAAKESVCAVARYLGRAIRPPEASKMEPLRPVGMLPAWVQRSLQVRPALPDADPRARDRGGDQPVAVAEVSTDPMMAVLEAMPDAGLVVDATGHIVAANALAEEMFGHNGGALAGKAIEILVPERYRHRHREHRAGYMEAAVSRPMGVGLELTGRRSDGSEFPVDISLAPVTSAGRSLVVAAVRDLTGQRLLTHAQAQLASIVQSSLDAIIATSLDGLISSWNPAAEKLLGYEPDEVLGRHISVLVPESSSPVFEDLLEVANRGGRAQARDTRWRRRDGSEPDVAVSISPLRDQGGRLLGYSSIVRDISDRKQAENELRRLLAQEARLQRQHAALAEIRLALLSGETVSDVLHMITERAVELLSAEVATIARPEGEALRVVAAAGLQQPLVGELLMGEDMLGAEVFRRGEPHHVSALRGGVTSAGVPVPLPEGPAASVPVIAGAGVSAVLTIIRRSGGAAFEETEMAAAEALASQAALAFELEQARRDREQMMLVGDRERIARDLHDHVIQRLFATGMWLQGTMPFLERAEVQERISEAIDSLDDTIREIRNTIYAIARPTSGDRLRGQLIGLVEEAAESLGFEPSLSITGPVDVALSDETTREAVAVVREALSNAVRHAKASRLEVDVELSDDRLTVMVTDDGVGMPEDAHLSGVANLAERARILGGAFSCSRPPAGGTQITWSVPLRD
jgi:PAS domain S-box-containing protein